MPRTAVTPQTLKVAVGTIAALSLDKTWTATDLANMNVLNGANGREIFSFKNSHASSPYTFTISSTPDSRLGRTQDIGPYTLAAGIESAFVLPADGFRQSDGSVNFQASNAAILCNVTRVPDIW